MGCQILGVLRACVLYRLIDCLGEIGWGRAQLCKFGRDMIVAGTRSVFTFIVPAVPVCLECNVGRSSVCD